MKEAITWQKQKQKQKPILTNCRFNYLLTAFNLSVNFFTYKFDIELKH
jgi:hypothetical protein